ncbi:LysR family transcriptional regulator [Vibrio mangrovi]|uniref:HTH-type transcriptional regulator BenM n=1 Tax=Vibrio mangrovi TaxID=474394 RepID=A0A1Y6ITC2_9VIBR|nr:LysR family transcriptional regulator [Vibrio mangrovi]MDW6003476.1 LysR family transcriptional regulator [Vibrio mangrovi]SMR99732.1 HTH-type transcriptional regulator BenM [Vibrio mangrovi]
MEFRYLKYFVAVAQTRHFTRAAEQLGIAQPPLSQQIKKLEYELGVDLFKRLSRGVELTLAGEVFYADAVNILADVERAKAKIRQIARGEHTEVRIGFATSTSTCIQVLEKMGRLQHENINLKTAELPMSELAAQLTSKQLDIAIMRLPCYASESFERRLLLDDPFVAVIPADHALAQFDCIRMKQLREQKILLFPRETGPALFDGMHTLFADAGIRLEPHLAAPQLRTTIAMAQAGLGIAIVPYSLAEHLDNSVVVAKIEDIKLTSRIVVAWEASNLNKQVLKVVAKLSQTDE